MEPQGEEVRDDNDTVNPGSGQTTHGISEIGLSEFQEGGLDVRKSAQPGKSGGRGPDCLIGGFDA